MADSLHHVRQSKITAVILVLIVSLLLVITFASIYSTVIAEESITDFSTFLSGLDQRMKDEGVVITITFIAPFGNEQRIVTLGYGYENITISIQEIGQDYICLRAIEGGAEVFSCIPFSNIAAVDYINN